ncbi:ROK family protein, partial [Escherichia coli]
SLLVRIHRGAGAGLVIDNEILLNHRGNLGEIGHIQVDPLGDLCHCGNFGCLETIASNQAIENRVQQRLE